MTPLLEVSGVSLSFAGNQVLDRVDFSVPAGAVVSLIGPNGAGKTSLFNCITGFYKPQAGAVRFDGRETLPLKPYQVTEAGIARTFQNVRLFREMTVLENVMSGMHCRTGAGIVAAVLRPRSQRREEAEIKEASEACLRFVGIEDGWHREATTLPYGWQRRVEIARALATRPKLLLLDEPAAGLTSGEKEALLGLIARIRDERGVSVLLIEHDAGLVMRISERVSVLDHGVMIAEGSAREIQSNPRVIEAYLGADVGEDALLSDPPIVLQLKGIASAYGKIDALRGIDLEVPRGQIVTLLGANGAGKTTTLKTISGLVRAKAGQILFEGRNITAMSAHKIARSGVVHVPEGRHVLRGLSVRENLELGAFTVGDARLRNERLEQVFAQFPILQKRQHQDGSLLSGGEQQMLAIGRALMHGPKVLLLDEPSMGLAPKLVLETMQIVKRLNEAGTTILLVEQNARLALKFAHYGYVLESGSIRLKGPAATLRADPSIVQAYLGT